MCICFLEGVNLTSVQRILFHGGKLKKLDIEAYLKQKNIRKIPFSKRWFKALCLNHKLRKHFTVEHKITGVTLRLQKKTAEIYVRKKLKGKEIPITHITSWKIQDEPPMEKISFILERYHALSQIMILPPTSRSLEVCRKQPSSIVEAMGYLLDYKYYRTGPLHNKQRLRVTRFVENQMQSEPLNKISRRCLADLSTKNITDTLKQLDTTPGIKDSFIKYTKASLRLCYEHGLIPIEQYHLVEDLTRR